MDNLFEEKGYKVIDLNLEVEDLIVENFEDMIKMQSIKQMTIPVKMTPEEADLFYHKYNLFSHIYQFAPLTTPVGSIPVVTIPPLNIHMEKLSSIVHRDYLTSIVEKEIDLKIIPTFCYTRKYFQGSVLNSHVDRDACEISLTYCISGPEWEIEMGDTTIITKKGSGIIYKGCETEHGRSKPSSGEVIQLFAHWVISDGTRLNSAYDGGRNKNFYTV